jgi:transcriptional regulator with XRE-family HTH domain
MNRRLLQFLQAENLTQTQFADTLSVARGSVSHILSGRNKPGYDFLESLLLHYPNLNLEWLLTGKGKMYHETREESAPDSSQLDLFPISITEEPRQVSRILVFYDDNTYQEFNPKQ